MLYTEQQIKDILLIQNAIATIIIRCISIAGEKGLD
jgi:hypothetical protein